MAATGGRNGPALSEQLRDQAHHFDFFQAVRAAVPDGRRRRPVQTEPRRPRGLRSRAAAGKLSASASLASQSFPTGPVGGDPTHLRDGRRAGGNDRRSFHGLTGPQGVLPQHYTTLMIERVRAKDYALRDFLDIFNHRALSLFYRAWAEVPLPLRLRRPAIRQSGEEDLFTQSLYCLLGLGTGGLRGRRGV